MAEIVPIVQPAIEASTEYAAAFANALGLVGSVTPETDLEALRHRLDRPIAEVMRVLKTFPEVTSVGLEDEILAHFVFVALVAATSDIKVPPPKRVRAQLPGIPPGTIWTLLRQEAVDALSATLLPGQIWVRMDDVDHRALPLVFAVVQYQRRSLGRKFGSAGRRPGSRSPTRQELVERIRLAAEAGTPLSDTRIAEEALRTGVWAADVADDYPTRAKRIATLRTAARKG